MSLTRRCINPVSPGWARYFLVATRKYPKKRSPWRCAPNTGVPPLRCWSQQVLRGHLPGPAGARARSFSRPFGLTFVFAPRSACFKGQEKQTPPFIAEGRGGVARP